MKKEPIVETPNEILEKAIPVAEGLIKRRNFSVENLCHEMGAPLKEVVQGIGSVDELILHVNFRFMGLFVAKAAKLDAELPDHLQNIKECAIAWLEHCQGNAELAEVLMQHRWEDGFERPDWYMKRVAQCFLPIEQRLAKMAPQLSEPVRATAARAIYCMINGLYFLSANERATPAGIASQHRLLEAGVGWILKGLA